MRKRRCIYLPQWIAVKTSASSFPFSKTMAMDPFPTLSPSARLKFARFDDADAPELASLLADASLTRNITANGSSTERCLATARWRIAWHNSTWERYGYGVWALRACAPELAGVDRLLGWCGFIPPDEDVEDPEIIYAIDAAYRGIGLASEAARQAISWLFEATDYAGVTAVISARLNPGSVKVVTKLGLVQRGRMPFSVFLSGEEQADEIVEYEIWRLAHGPVETLDTLVEQVAFRAGQLSTVTSLTPARLHELLMESLAQRCQAMGEVKRQDQYRALLIKTFDAGRGDGHMDCYHVTRERWLEMTRGCPVSGLATR
jgi:RimJ/RimL family protein N-acetyltransferase